MIMSNGGDGHVINPSVTVPMNFAAMRSRGGETVSCLAPIMTAIGGGSGIMGDTASNTEGPAAILDSDKVRAEEQKYRVIVRDCVAANDGRPIFNRDLMHAIVVVENLFRTAEKEIDIVTERLFEPIYAAQPTIELVLSFLQEHKDAKLRILHEEPIDPSSHPLLMAIQTAGLMDRVELRRMTAEMKESIPYHFFLCDARHFRFEPSKKRLEALAQFGEPETGRLLKDRFDQFYSSLALK